MDVRGRAEGDGRWPHVGEGGEQGDLKKRGLKKGKVKWYWLLYRLYSHTLNFDISEPRNVPSCRARMTIAEVDNATWPTF